MSLEYSMSVKLLTEHHLVFLGLKGGYRGSSESTLVKMPHCWKSHVTAQILASNLTFDFRISKLTAPTCKSVHWNFYRIEPVHEISNNVAF